MDRCRCIYADRYIAMYVWIQIYVCIGIYLDTYAQIDIHAHIYMYTHDDIHVQHPYLHQHLHPHALIHTCICICWGLEAWDVKRNYKDKIQFRNTHAHACHTQQFRSSCRRIVDSGTVLQT